MFILYVFSKHSIPFHVISDRGPEFMSNFFHSLDIVLDMQLYFTLGYYSKGDRQTNHTNQTSKQYLHIYYNYQQDNWSELLPLAKFSYNNTSSITTDVSLFFAIIQTSPLTLNVILLPLEPMALLYLNELQYTLKAEITMA